MKSSNENIIVRGDAAVEALLEKAVPRPSPPTNDAQAVREAVMAEWRAVAGKANTRQRMTYFAMAASVVLGVAVAFNLLRVVDTPALQVATISYSHGSIYVLGEQSELREMTDLSAVFAGQIIQTGDAAGIGFEWSSGGSLRINENTRIEFTSPESIYLKSGQIYFDSHSDLVAAITGSSFEIETDHGQVKHLGTQYMTTVDSHDLSVSVREGKVQVDGRYVDTAEAVAGQRIILSGGAAPAILNFDAYGPAWAWAEEMAPPTQLDGKSIDDFLVWVARETGLTLRYEEGAEQVAGSGKFIGEVKASPREELRLRMLTANLSYRIDGGTIYVSTNN